MNNNVGSAIVNIFAVVWAGIALHAAHAPLWTVLAPALVSATLFAIKTRRPEPERTAETRRRIGRVVGMASAAEGVGIWLGITLVTWAGRPDLWACVLAAVVGAHFLPLARWIPVARYYLTGAALLLAAALGLALPEGMREVVIGSLGAVILWATLASYLVANPVSSGQAAYSRAPSPEA